MKWIQIRSLMSTNLLKFVQEVNERTNEGKPMDYVYLNFVKAFDKVPRVRLAETLQAYRKTGQALR